jgi:hypothetical protein
MDMVAHQHVGIETEMAALLVSGKDFQVFLVIRRLLEYLLLLIAPGDDVIKCAVVFYSWLSCHDVKITEPTRRVNNSIFKSDPIRSLNPDG